MRAGGGATAIASSVPTSTTAVAAIRSCGIVLAARSGRVVQRARVVLELAHRLGLELAHPLAADREHAAHLVERPRLLSAEAEAQLDDPPLAVAQLLQGLAQR